MVMAIVRRRRRAPVAVAMVVALALWALYRENSGNR